MGSIVALRAAKRARPNIENRKVPPKRSPNADRRAREYLTPEEVGRLIEHAGKLGRHGQRDAALLTVAYRHGLRVSELVALRWDMIDLKQGLLHVNRLKNETKIKDKYLLITSPFSVCCGFRFLPVRSRQVTS